ncbi:PREDICTED: lamin-B receptor-like [Rhagoletis zephyria]|uniref:lamin-B receptor-like n=1 Tax=Rhagoletis zephyria TaxID=28612 RepID=UPI0008114370|nr:PREDICTED: lamin-B receptor-like [Rhagoletis zephyria]XP_017461648.1 PREDICTED: lamin-B receptor-like [Rhagoletis zephyria]
MEGRRTSGRRKRNEEPGAASTEKVSTTSTHINVSNKRSSSKTNVSPPRRTSPGRTRRSSRPRASNLASAPSTTTILIRSSPVSHPSPIKEVKETPSPKTTASKTRIPTAVGSNVNSAGRSSPRFTTKSTSSLHSTFSSSSTQKTYEIRSTTSALDAEFKKLSDYIRRSVSKTIGGVRREGTHTPTTNTEVESRYSRSISRSIFDDGASSKAEFSDNEPNDPADEDDEEEGTEHYKSFNISTQHSYSTSALGQNCRQLEIPKEFGGWAGTTLLMLLVPCIVYYLQSSCQKNVCELRWPNFELDSPGKSTLWKSIFNNEAVAAYIFFQLGVFVLSALLFGRYVRLPTDRISGIGGIQYGAEYKFNVLPIAIVITLGAGCAEYLNYPLATFVLEHQLRFCIYGFINAFILSLWAYLRSDMLKSKSTQAQLNIYGKTGNFLVDYAQGRQLNPKWLNLVEFKLVFYRVALLSTLLYAECYLYKQLSLTWIPVNEGGIWNTLSYYYDNVRYDSAALLTSGMLVVYIMDAIIFEHHLASSFEMQGEGFGALLLLRYAATPYLLTAVARYFYEQKHSSYRQSTTPLVCCFAGYVSVAVLITGLLLKRISSAIKYKYRVNPSNAYFVGVETIHTFQGRRLLLGSLWGRIRQPNYAGDLLALCALALPLFLRFAWPPLICILLLWTVLLHRTQRVQVRNMSRYHSSWVRYCNKVRYYILPKVY